MPIHLKGGPKDALLYRATMTLTILGGLISGLSLYDLLNLFHMLCFFRAVEIRNSADFRGSLACKI